MPKGDLAKRTDWSHWSPAMQEYCRRDVDVAAHPYLHIIDNAPF